jgi:hypothetical protein
VYLLIHPDEYRGSRTENQTAQPPDGQLNRAVDGFVPKILESRRSS